jgi:hypothetical protein
LPVAVVSDLVFGLGVNDIAGNLKHLQHTVAMLAEIRFGVHMSAKRITSNVRLLSIGVCLAT